jgi:hypothetical protein
VKHKECSVLLKVTLTLFSIAVASLIGSLVAYGQSGIYEDQYILCNFEEECFTFNQDDYLSRAQTEEFQLFFNNDMDTYSISDLDGEINDK